MNTTVVLCIKRIMWVIVLTETVMCGTGKKILLKSVQHHTGSAMVSTHLELGTMVLFFSEQVMPILVHKKNISDDKIEQRIVFPHVGLPSEQVKAMIEQINNQLSEAYDLKFSITQVPVQGLELLVTYNQNKVLYNYETAVSSSSLPGYVFRFINQECYKDLIKKVNEKGITHTAWQKKSRVL
jgi:hypothetical protein